MAAVNNVVTRGFSIGTIALVVLRGYSAGVSTATSNALAFTARDDSEIVFTARDDAEIAFGGRS